MACQILAIFSDNLTEPFSDLWIVHVVIVDPALIACVIGRIYKDVIFDTSPVAGKVYKNSENRRKQGKRQI